MKKLIIAAVLSTLSFGAFADTHFNVAGEGEIVISNDGKALAINNDREKVSELFTGIPMMQENGCDVQLFVNVKDNKDIASVTLCERLKPMVKFGRYYNGQKVGGWLVDATRYMWFDK